ncbi:MAG: TusE/DsrC/DsvC family sulfur relay protein [Gammaproteobacteria bacterium]|nr:TusE/DsrC/DsvC family sulfur relay protein [Gammaproteobacteria bacterium]
MTTIENASAAVRDEEGYLVNPDEWSRELAVALAREESLVLTDEHWTAIEFMRDYQAKNGITPDIRHVAKHLATRLGLDKKAAKERMFALFPYGYVKQACKIAGMKRPRAWSTG